MTAATSALHALAVADLDGWAGLPPDLTLADARADLAVVAEIGGRARLGAARAPLAWVAAESSVYVGGLRLYVDGERVLVVEGRDPMDAAGEPLGGPDLGEPELVLDTLVGPARVPGLEHVYAGRGLAVHLSPGERGLRAVLGFAPTTVEDWVERLRPEQAGRSRFPLRQEFPS